MEANTQQKLRNRYRHARKALSPTERRQYSKQICQRILSMGVYHQARHIALYRATPDEVDVSDVWTVALEQGKHCYFPALQSDKTLLFVPAEAGTQFSKSNYQVEEPLVNHELAVPLTVLNLIIIPLVAFDTQGSRIGMGWGCYDRALTVLSAATRLGVAFSCQQAPHIVPQPWDKALHVVVTENAIHWSIKK